MREKIDSLIGKFIYALLWFLSFATLTFGMFVLSGCGAPPLTEQEQFDKEYAEADRKNMYYIWEQSCLDQEGIIYSDNVLSRAWKKTPRKWDWDYDGEKERPSLGNSVVCVSQRELDEMMK